MLINTHKRDQLSLFSDRKTTPVLKPAKERWSVGNNVLANSDWDSTQDMVTILKSKAKGAVWTQGPWKIRAAYSYTDGQPRTQTRRERVGRIAKTTFEGATLGAILGGIPLGLMILPMFGTTAKMAVATAAVGATVGAAVGAKMGLDWEKKPVEKHVIGHLTVDARGNSVEFAPFAGEFEKPSGMKVDLDDYAPQPSGGSELKPEEYGNQWWNSPDLHRTAQ